MMTFKGFNTHPNSIYEIRSNYTEEDLKEKEVVTIIDFEERPFSELYGFRRFTKILSGSWRVSQGKINIPPYMVETGITTNEDTTDFFTYDLGGAQYEEHRIIRSAIITTEEVLRIINEVSLHNIETFQRNAETWFCIDIR